MVKKANWLIETNSLYSAGWIQQCCFWVLSRRVYCVEKKIYLYIHADSWSSCLFPRSTPSSPPPHPPPNYPGNNPFPTQPVAHYHSPFFPFYDFLTRIKACFCLEKEKEISHFGRLGNKQTNIGRLNEKGHLKFLIWTTTAGVFEGLVWRDCFFILFSETIVFYGCL